MVALKESAAVVKKKAAKPEKAENKKQELTADALRKQIDLLASEIGDLENLAETIDGLESKSIGVYGLGFFDRARQELIHYVAAVARGVNMRERDEKL